ncbi:MAG TPA: hypothetical protein VGR31_12850 [Planctomycetota bacterium]|jgi:hypothetical protein|nr:hypothetical protein [Planctomycetota bacterium]
MPWLAVGLLVSFLAIVLVTAIRYANHRHEIFRNAWRAYASSRGLTWNASSGPWYRRSSHAIEGSVDGVPVRVDTYVVSTGKSTTIFTRVRASLARPSPAKVVATRRNLLTGLAEKLGRRTIASGDSGFDELYALRSKEPATALALFDERARAEARKIGRRVSILVKQGEVKLTWHGMETDPSVLDATCGTASAIARASANA